MATLVNLRTHLATGRAMRASGALDTRSLVTWLIAGYFLYLPLANMPVMKVIRNGVLQLPQPDPAGFEQGLHPWILLFPDFAFAVALLGVVSLTLHGKSRRHWTRGVLLMTFGAFLVGGAICHVRCGGARGIAGGARGPAGGAAAGGMGDRVSRGDRGGSAAMALCPVLRARGDPR